MIFPSLLKKSQYKILLFLFLFSLVLYPLLFYLGMTNLKQIINFCLVALFFFVSFPVSLEYIKYYKVKPGFLIAIFLLLYITFISLFRNEPIEYIPSFMRYFLYLFVFSVAYIKTKTLGLNENHIKSLSLICFYIAILFGVLEFVTGNVAYFNGAYRSSGNFSGHSLGYALFLFVLLMYFYYQYVITKKKYFLVISIIAFLFLYLTQSRALILLVFIAIPVSKLILNRNFFYRIFTFFMILVLALIFYFIVPVYLSDTRLFSIYEIVFNGRIDGSTLTRLYIINESLNNLTNLDKILGIGLGGFNQYFFDITGRIGFAAHNIYLQFFVEGGWLGLILFIILQFYVILKLRKNYRRSSCKEGKLMSELGLSLFLSIEVFGFLLNAHYFYQSHFLFMFLLGFIISFGNLKVKYNKFSK